jgi:hypothetical protein
MAAAPQQQGTRRSRATPVFYLDGAGVVRNERHTSCYSSLSGPRR